LVGIPKFLEREREREREREGAAIDRVNSWRTIHPEVGLSVALLVGPFPPA